MEHLVFKWHDNISPQVEVSVRIMPDVARVLDQLGLFDAVEAEVEPLDKSHICYPDGSRFTSVSPMLVNQRHVYHPSQRG